ncbi:hypothetical protein HZ326_25088 [Fusarium oxysporum f. sp. albedinis]|nr:hypothetical protein HZ326_25088 [Fusarium oxysporum f. sp. albedinis]
MTFQTPKEDTLFSTPVSAKTQQERGWISFDPRLLNTSHRYIAETEIFKHAPLRWVGDGVSTRQHYTLSNPGCRRLIFLSSELTVRPPSVAQ